MMLNRKIVMSFLVLSVLLFAGTSFAADPTYQATSPSGIHLASGIADASGTGGAAYLEYWVWDGGDGYYYYTYRLYNTTFSPYISYLTIANPTREPYVVTGCSGGWNPLDNTKGTPWIGSSSITQISVIQWASSSSYSNIYPGYNSWGSADGQLFQVASTLPPSSAGFVVAQGDASISASGLVAAPGSSTMAPRSVGYWKHQSGTKGQRKEAGSIPSYLAVIGSNSNVFDNMTIASCNAILSVPDNSDMRQKAKAQLLALWLNVVSSKLCYDAALTLQDPLGQIINTSAKQIITNVENTILNTGATLDELEYAKDLVEIVNNL